MLEDEAATQRLRRSERRFRALIENSADAIALVGADGRILYASPATKAILGYDLDGFVGRNCLELIHPEDLDFVAGRLRESLDRPGVIVRVQGRLLHEDGSWRFLEGSFNNLLGDPSVEAIVHNYRDISERHGAQEALRASESRKKAILDAALDGVITIDGRGRVVEFNPAAERLFGYSQAEAVGREMAELIIPPPLREEHRRGLERQASRGESRVLGKRIEMPAMRKDGKVFPVELAITRVDAGGATLFTGHLRDISDRRKAEETRSRLAAIVESSDDAVVSTDLDGTVLSWNRGAERMYGYLAPEIVGRSISVLEPPQRSGEMAGRLQAGATAKGVQRYETVRMRKDGTHTEVAVTLSPVRDAAGKITGLASIARDVTERRRAEEAVRQSQAFLEKAQEVAHIGSWSSGLSDEAPVVWSKETCRIFGVLPSEFDGRAESFYARVHPDDLESVKAAGTMALARGETFESEHRILRPDGTMRWVYERRDLERDAQGHPHRMIGTVQDITELKQLREQLLQSQKIEAIGRLAGGVAHDFNNLLTAILGYCDMMKRGLASNDPLHEDLEEIRKAGERAAALTGQLLAFSRRQILEPRVLDINTVVSDIGQMLRRLIGEDVELHLALGPEVARIRADPGQIQQVITNLTVNARDAMPGGGELTIETSNADLDQNYANHHPPVTPGSYVLLAVTDTGAGMDGETLSHVFEPFYTTKDYGKGVGLGLSTVYGIVKQSGGYIWVYSKPGRGTTFEIYFPRVEEDVEAAGVSAPELSLAGGSETILLVEDEPSVRKLMNTILAALGYTVLEAERAEEALDIARKHTGPLELLLTDVVMPGMGGPELASRLGRFRPAVRVLFMSGYTDDAILRQKVLELGTAFLQKPFTPATLARKVREALAGR